MDSQNSLNLNDLLQNMQNSNREEIYQIILDLDILADRGDTPLIDELRMTDLGPLLRMLPRLSGKTKTCALRLTGKLFKLIRPTTMISKYFDIVMDMLRNYYNEEITTFYLQQIILCSSTPEGISLLIENFNNTSTPILELVAKNVKNKSLDVAKHATKVIQKLLMHNEGIINLLSDDFMIIFDDLLLEGAIVRFRIYQLFVDCLIMNENLMENKQIIKIVTLLITELESSDILSHLNCLEMLSAVASSSLKGLKFITEYGTLDQLKNLFRSSELDAIQQLLLPGAIKCFGSIATAMPHEVLQKYPDFQSFIFENMNNDDIMLKVLCFETISSICSSEKGLNILYQNHEKMNKVMNNFAKVIQSPLDEALKTRLMDAFVIIFTKSDDSFGSTNSQIKRELYQQLSEQPIQLLMKCSQLPFSKIRHSSLGALKAVSSYSWSESDMAETAGFLEYLLDRKTEMEKEGKELKYEIMKTLTQSATSKENLGGDYYEQICKYVVEGPFYSEQQTAVDYEMKN